MFGDDVMACAARVEVGPGAQTFWAIWDRSDRRLVERTRLRLPGCRGEVWTEDGSGHRVERSRGERAVVRIDARHPDAGPVEATLRFGDGESVEVVCPTPAGGYVWTRKRADVPVEGVLRIGAESRRLGGRGVEDESAGYHPRHTVWSWSAGVGRAADGRSVGWNLVSGVNDPVEGSERAIWVDGRRFEPGPVEFEGLDAITFDDGSRLAFTAEAERRRSENLIFVRYAYRQPFGRFAGTLPGDLELESGLGVVEHHDARW